jgi:hypothetical protein
MVEHLLMALEEEEEDTTEVVLECLVPVGAMAVVVVGPRMQTNWWQPG